MKPLLLSIAALTFLFMGCSDGGGKYTERVWSSDGINFNIWKNDTSNSGKVMITIIKQNGQYTCYYYNKTDSAEACNFPVSYENGAMKGFYKDAKIEMRLGNNNSLFVNGFEVRPMSSSK